MSSRDQLMNIAKQGSKRNRIALNYKSITSKNNHHVSDENQLKTFNCFKLYKSVFTLIINHTKTKEGLFIIL